MRTVSTQLNNILQSQCSLCKLEVFLQSLLCVFVSRPATAYPDRKDTASFLYQILCICFGKRLKEFDMLFHKNNEKVLVWVSNHRHSKPFISTVTLLMLSTLTTDTQLTSVQTHQCLPLNPRSCSLDPESESLITHRAEI